MNHPTLTNYQSFSTAYDWFNHRLFANALPRCLITMQRRKQYYGFFVGGNWAATKARGKPRPARKGKTDETVVSQIGNEDEKYSANHAA